MLPDWRSIERLLLICSEDTTDIELAVAAIERSLPNTKITQVRVQAINYETLELSIIYSDSKQVQPSTLSIQSLTFDAAIIFTMPDQSPYSLAYLCYLAEISIRVGQSKEFGGSVLSVCIPPAIDPVSPTDYHLHLLNAVGITIAPEFAFAS